MNERIGKRLLSALLSVVMLLSLLPTMAFAEGEESAGAATTATRITDVSTLKVDDQIVIANAAAEYALGTNQKTNNREAVVVTPSGSSITLNSEVQVLTLKSGTKDDTWAFYTGSGYLYAASSEKNFLKTEKALSDNSSWSITLTADGVATVTAQGTNTHNLLRYNYNKGTPLFSAYTGGQDDIALYKLDESAGGSGGSGSIEAVASPTANYPTGSALASGTEIVFSCATADAAIQYKVGDGAYQTYTAPIALTADTTFTVKATKEGMTDSAEVTFAYTVKAAETAFVTIAEALAGASNATFTVKGVVTLVDGSNYYLQDDTGGICLRLATSTNDIKLGDTVIGTGKRADFKGLPQLGSGTFVKSSGLTLAAKLTTIGGLSAKDIGTYVKLTGLEITEIYDNNGQFANPNITLKDGDGKTIQLYKAVVADKTALKVGDKLDVTAAVGVFITTLQLRNTVSDEVKAARQSGIITTLSDGDTIVIFNPANGKALSTEYTGFYNQGTDVKLADGKLTGYTKKDIWTVGVNADGTYTFSTADGDKLSMDTSYTSTPLNKVNDTWKVVPAKTADCFYVDNATRTDNYRLQWFARKNNWSAYTGTGPNFEVQFYLVTDSGEEPSGGLPTAGAQVVLYNQSAKAVLASQIGTAESPSIGKAAATVDGGKATCANGAVVFTVEKNGEYYRFKNEAYGYLCSNGTGNNAFYSQTASNDADWKVRTCSGGVGGFELESRTAKFNNTHSQWLEYYADSFKSYSMYSKDGKLDYTIYSFYFYPVADGTALTKGVVNLPAVVINTVPDAFVDTDYTLAFTVDAPFGVEGAMTAKLGGTALTVTKDAEGTYTVTVPAAMVTGEKLQIVITGKDTTGKAISRTVEVTVKDEPVLSDPQPAKGAQTGDEKRPEISVALTNAGKNPAITMTVGGKSVTPTLKNGRITYTPAAKLADGRVEVTVTVKRTDNKESSLTWFFTVGKTQHQLYFGQLHSHTQYSDGAGSLDSALEYVKNLPDSANVQFVAFTDHSNYFDSTSAPNPEDALYDMTQAASDSSRDLWKEYKGKVAAFNESQSTIVAIGGFEMTWSGGPGHINTFNTPGIVSRNNKTLNSKTNDAGMKAYYALLSRGEGVDSISQLNHPGKTFGNFADFSYWDGVIDTRVYMVEVGNGEGQIGAGGYYPSYEQYIMALDKGWHVAPTNNQDNHKGKWGNANDARDVIITDNFTEEGIYAAIRERHMYATEDKNLEVTYTVNGNLMGTIIKDVPEKLTIEVTVNDPDIHDSIKKVELVANSGRVVHTWDSAAELTKGSLSVELKPEYSYYFVRVTEGDGDLAVTAPVWVGDTLKLGITNAVCGTATPVTGEELTLTTTLFNGEGTDATVKSMTYAIKGGAVIKTDKAPKTLGKSSTLDIDFKYTPKKALVTTITVTAVVELDGKEYTFTKDVTLDVLNADSLVYIGIDAAHYNEYVAGNYKDSMGNFGNLAAENSVRTVQLNTSADLIAACSNPKYKALILTAPSRRLEAAQSDPRTYTADELKAIAAFNAGGGTVILAGWSDNYENYPVIQNNPAIKHMAATQNELLEALGSSLRISDDATYDDVRSAADGVDKWRLYFSSYNMDNFLTGGVEFDAEHPYDALYTERFSHYGGASIYAVGADGKPTTSLPATVSPVVYGHATTYSVDVDEDGLGGAGVPKYAYADNDNRLLVMATEQLAGKGLIIVSGAAFMSNFEVQASVDNAAEKNYSNYRICQNLLRYLNPITVTDIKTVQAEKDEGVKFTVEGIVTSNASGYDKDTAFFDCIYVQDATAGINCFPVAGNFKIGDRVRISGTTSSYQGERQLAVTTIEKLGEGKPVTPTLVTAAQIVDGSVLGSLVRVKGTITRIENAEGIVQTIMVRDGSGKTCRLFIDGYITKDKGISLLTVGNSVDAIGLASWDDTFALDGKTIAPRVRIRDRAEIVCTKAPVKPGDDSGNEPGGGSGSGSGSGSSSGYYVTSGDGQTAQAGALVQFGISRGAASHVTSVWVDGVRLDAKDYVIRGNALRLQGPFTAKLSQGFHTGLIRFDDGSASSFSFTVSGATSPRTGDPGVVLYVALTVASVTGMARLTKRKED